MYIIRGLVFLMIGLGWGINFVPRKKARLFFSSLLSASRRGRV